MTFYTFAALSALFAALTAILAKVGVEGVPSNLATAIRTLVILPFAWLVTAATGELRTVPSRSLLFLVLSGLATGCSWLAYFRALQLGPASRVAPIDKLSLPLTLLFAAVFLHEPMTPRLVLGVALMVVGAFFTL
jgi:transporter family protein